MLQVVAGHNNMLKAVIACANHTCDSGDGLMRFSEVALCCYKQRIINVKDRHHTCARSIYVHASNMSESRIHCLVQISSMFLFTARDAHQMAKCGSGAILGVRKCVPGEHYKHLRISHHFHEI